MIEQTIVYLECGGYHTVALTNKGELFSWGRGDVYQLGIPFKHLCKDETGHLSLMPQRIEYFIGKIIKSIACGEAHTLALDIYGRVYAFG